MNFWDASALVPLCLSEPRTAEARALWEARSPVVAWCLSRTEVLSALCRLQREGAIDEARLVAARERRDQLFDAIHVVREINDTLRLADRLLLVHGLRAADALQLAAALLAMDGTPDSHGFVTFDGRLASAARKEGFRTFGEARDAT